MPNLHLKRVSSAKVVSAMGDVGLPTVVVDPEPPTQGPFVLGTTKPKLTNPLSPTVNDNVGWDGNSSGGTIGSQASPAGVYTVASGVTVENMVFWCDVILASATSKMKNCIVYGGTCTTYISTQVALINAPNGGQLERVTVYGWAHSVKYWRNAVNHRGGVLTIDRSALYRCVDLINSDGASQQLIVRGSIGGRYAFFDNDADHKNDAVHPWWTHNDWIQLKGGSMSVVHTIDGNVVEAFFDTTGVTWSNGSPGQGVASSGAGSIGMPHTALNAGYWDAAGRGTWANGISHTNSPTNSVVKRNWVNGVSASSGMLMWTGDTAGCIMTIESNIIGLGGKPSGGGIIYIVQWPGTSTRTIGSGGTANKFASDSSVPASLQGTNVPFTSTGAKIDMDLY